MKILLIDDNEMSLDCLSEELKLHQFQTACSIDPRNAIQLFQEGNFDVVITDFKMPYLNGVEVCRLIRALKPGIPVIMVSGHPDVENDETPCTPPPN